ncbi:MAG: hypothetical protein WC943_11580, partial [Elusimicrobiota bacterium]
MKRPSDGPTTGRRRITYRQAGVDTALADRLVDYIASRTKGIGGFAGLFPLELGGRGEHSLVACTDGVGTKLKIAFLLDPTRRS